ncbi:MAG: LacI family DNA-binding transcriptional regulator [Micromonosporaceae bacterium]|nr:LacI family DNA-binding transcriptional regulator [Micromonosporaceae bacterium]
MTSTEPEPAAAATPAAPAQPTLRDVALAARVSPMTVSRTLRGDEGVSEATRQRVREVARSLGYRPNEVARNLRLGRSDGLIGLVVTNLANPFYSQLALGVEEALAEQGMRVLLGNSGEDPTRERQLVHDFISRRLDGLVVVPATHHHGHLGPVQTLGMPVVLAASLPVKVDVDAVLLDDFGGTWEATRHLISAGHHRIGFLGLPAATWTGSERYRGYCAALEEAGIPLSAELSGYRQRDVAAAEKATEALLDLPDPPTAIFAANNRNTIGAYRAIRARGATTRLAGFDDFELADSLGLPLTLVAYDPRELGREAAVLLCDRIAEAGAGAEPGAPRRKVISTRIVEYG